MSYPDFRATERAYQLMAQVAGRAGRKESQGTVIIQTRQPDAPVLEMVRRHDYKGFHKAQLQERLAFNYPPYSRLTIVTVKGTEQSSVEKTATDLAANLADLFGPDRVLGPDAPPVSKIQYRHIRRIIIKAGLDMATWTVRERINEAVSKTASTGSIAGISFSFDPDPQ